MSSVLNLAFFEAVVVAERIREGRFLSWRVQIDRLCRRLLFDLSAVVATLL